MDQSILFVESRAILLPATSTKKDALLHNHIITFKMRRSIPQKSDTKIVMTVVILLYVGYVCKFFWITFKVSGKSKFQVFFRYSHKDNLIMADDACEKAVIESLKAFKKAGG